VLIAALMLSLPLQADVSRQRAVQFDADRQAQARTPRSTGTSRPSRNVQPGDSRQKGEVLAEDGYLRHAAQAQQPPPQPMLKRRGANTWKFRADPTKQADADDRQTGREKAANAPRPELYQDCRSTAAKIRAPFDGVVLKGDLTDSATPKKEGDELFTIAANNSAGRADVERARHPGFESRPDGKLATTSLPTEKYPFTVERIVPLGQAKEGKMSSPSTPRSTKLLRHGCRACRRSARRCRKSRTWIWTHKLWISSASEDCGSKERVHPNC
jgi:hypothetical protein